jgi:hypothetical protein
MPGTSLKSAVDLLELLLAGTATGALPVLREVLEGNTGRDLAPLNPFGWIVSIPTVMSLASFHARSPFVKSCFATQLHPLH